MNNTSGEAWLRLFPSRARFNTWDRRHRHYYCRARYYDASSGRFLSEDPIRFSGGIDFYRYVGNEPTGIIDPTGRNPAAIGATVQVVEVFGLAVITYYVVTRPSVQEGLQDAAVAISDTFSNFFARKKPKQDPFPFPGYPNPGHCDKEPGKCKPCPPPSTYWEQLGNAHGSTSGVHYHQWVWNQKPYPDCTCMPSRLDFATPPSGGTPYSPGGAPWP